MQVLFTALYIYSATHLSAIKLTKHTKEYKKDRIATVQRVCWNHDCWERKRCWIEHRLHERL